MMRSLLMILVIAATLSGSVFAQSGTSGNFRLALATGSSQQLVPGPVSSPETRHPNNPGTARLYSIIIPGGGQFYNGETGKGFLFLGAAALGYTLFATNIPSTAFYYDPDYYYASYGYWYNKGNAALCYGGLAVALGATVWSVIDASKGAVRHNKRIGLVSVDLGGTTLWANIDQKVSRHRLGCGFTLGLSF